MRTPKVQELMTPAPGWCSAHEPLCRAAELMAEHDCGAVPVVDDPLSRRPVGVVTDRDIVMRIVVPRLHPCECQVYHAMTPRVVSVHVDAGFCECARAMRANRVRRVVVVDDRGGVIGMVTDGDLARACHGDPELEHELAQVVEEVSACAGDGHAEAAVPVMAGMTAVLDRPNHHE